MPKFIFVRHGESQANLENRIGKRETLLSPHGIEQAHLSGQTLKDKGIKYILCSPYVRTKRTAEIIAEEIGLDKDNICFMDELAERHMGSFEGTLKTEQPEWYMKIQTGDMEPGEKVLKRQHKALKVIKKLSKKGLVLVVGHAAAGFYMLNAAKGVKKFKDLSDSVLIPNAEYLEVEING